MKKASIVILTYNQLKYTKMCIESIRLFTKPSHEIIVVDNASTDGTVEWLKEQSDITAIFNDVNKGFPAGCNQGILKAGGDTIVLLNNDTIVTPRWLDNLLVCLNSSEKIGAVAPASNFCGYQSIPTSYNNLDEMIVFADKFNVSNSSLWEERLKLSGLCLAIEKKVICQIGLLDEIFSPGYVEDDDYSFRICQAGYKLIFCKDTFIHHYGNISSKDNADSEKKILDTIEKNSKKFEKKWGFRQPYPIYIHLDILGMMNNTDCLRNIKVLEIGCGCGGTLLRIKQDFPHSEVFGIEQNQNAARIARTFCQVQVCDLEKTDLGYNHSFFDYILLPDVLEHLMDPWDTLAKLKKYLNPNGKMIVKFRNAAHISVILSLLNGTWNYTESDILKKSHLRYFTLSTIKDMFEKNGYIISDVKPNLIPPLTSENFDTLENQLNIFDHLKCLVAPEIQKELLAYSYLIGAKPIF